MSIATPNKNSSILSILLVDDDEVILNLLCENFKLYGLRIHKAGNGIKGWNLFNSEKIDIVLTDIQMPGIDGAELATRIRKKSPDTTIALISGGEAVVGCKLIKSGIADFFFEKPPALSYVCKTLIAHAQNM